MKPDQVIGLLQHDIGSAAAQLLGHIDLHPEDVAHIDVEWLERDYATLRQIIQRVARARQKEAA